MRAGNALSLGTSGGRLAVSGTYSTLTKLWKFFFQILYSLRCDGCAYCSKFLKILQVAQVLYSFVCNLAANQIQKGQFSHPLQMREAGVANLQIIEHQPAHLCQVLEMCKAIVTDVAGLQS